LRWSRGYTTTMKDAILTARDVTKRFGRVVALDNADLDLYPGEVLAIIGDNGAGKSCLIKALSGALTPDSGEIKLEGITVNFQSPMQARVAGMLTIQNIEQSVETLSGGQRQGIAVARAAAFGSKVIIMDEPTAALGVKESRRVLELIQDVRGRGISIILISHNMPHVFEVADRIHIHRLGKRLCTIQPNDFSMSDAVAFMTGARQPPADAVAA